MTLEGLAEYIDEKYDLEFVDDTENTVEEMVKQGNECLMDDDYKDSWDSIKESKTKLEKYIYENYKVKYAVNGIWNQGFIVFNNDYKFVDFIATIE